MTIAAGTWPFPGLVWGPYPQRPLHGPAPERALPWTLWGAARQARAMHAWMQAGEAPADAPALQQRLVRAGVALRATLGIEVRWTQVLAAWVLLHDTLAEVATGEGKTHALALAAAVAARAGTPVHVVTANDYLARRDAETLAPLYAALGLRCAFVDAGMDPRGRREAYAANVTYCTARELGFDYLRDALAGPLEASPVESRFAEATPRRLLPGLCMALLDEADALLIDEARTPLVLARPGAGPGRDFHEHAWRLALGLREREHFRRDAAGRRIFLLPAGRAVMAHWPATGDALQDHSATREEALAHALTALHVLERDRDYVVRDGQVQLVDETTGRAGTGRRWSRGLHEFVELKEGLAPGAATATAAQVTLQQFFARYLRLAGVSGTLVEARGELRRVYGLGVVVVPPHGPSRAARLPDRLLATGAELHEAMADEIASVRAAGRPVLAGLGSVAEGEALAAVLDARGIPHQRLHARADADEPAVIARAGEPGCVTVTTNLAGRGSDILPTAEALAAGGLHVLVGQLNASARTDRQFTGRAARQGQPGSSRRYVALDFPLVARWAPRWLREALGRRAVPPWIARSFIRAIQAAEGYARVQQRATLWRRSREQTEAFGFGRDLPP